MATVVRMDYGEYTLAYEYCGTANCPIYVKFCNDGLNWVSSDTGDAVSTTDDLFMSSSPFIVWEPTAKQLILTSQSVHPIGNGSQVSQTHRAVFINSEHGRRQWRWSPASWNVRAGYLTCNSNYSPNFL
jgi:hypothetical protein